MPNVKLPEHRIMITIADLVIGEEVYTVPWAIKVDENGDVWIRGDYTFDSQPGGTVKMRIKRVAGGFAVWLPEGEQYEPRRVSSELKLQLIPVIELWG